MLSTEACLAALFDSASVDSTKLNTLAEYLREHGVLGSRMGCRAARGREIGIALLFDALQEKVKRDALHEVLRRLKVVAAQKGREAAERKRAAAATLATLEHGTPIVIRNGEREEILFFLKMHRTRFDAEHTDGRVASVPVVLFIRIHESEAPARLPEAMARVRALVRELAEPHGRRVRDYILGHAEAMLVPLRDELQAAHERISNAPLGRSHSLLLPGMVKKIDPADLRLVERIPAVISAIAEKISLDKACAALDGPASN